jgi:hypothetical protein
MDGWIDGRMIQILIHKSQREPQGTQVIFLACLYWRFHRQWGMDGWMYVWIRGGKFIHPQIWWESQGK